MKFIFLFIYHKEHVLNAVKASLSYFLKAAKLGHFANSWFEKAAYQLITDSILFSQKAFKPLEKVDLVNTYFAIGDENFPNLI